MKYGIRLISSSGLMSSPPAACFPAFKMASLCESYHARSLGSDKVSYAPRTSLNRVSASSGRCEFLSGCHSSAILRYARFSSDSLASRLTPRMS